MLIVIEFLLTIFAQDSTIYYVAIGGVDSSTCGTESNPCGTINDVVTNYPGVSCVVSVSTGVFITSQIAFQRSAFVVFQGTGNITIAANWALYAFINSTNTSGFGFHDLALILSGGGDVFSIINSGNSIGFFNITLSYNGYAEGSWGDFIDLNDGGNLIFDNVTFTQAVFNTYFIFIGSVGGVANVSVARSTFTNLTILQDGGLVVFNARGDSYILLNSSVFSESTAENIFIGFWAEVTDQKFEISNNLFNNTFTYLPIVYIENDVQSIVSVQNSTWNNATAVFVSGALEIVGRDDVRFNLNNVTLVNLKFTNCVGDYSGALLVGYNSLVLSNSTFANNSANYGNDLVQGVDKSSRFIYDISNSYSSSALPKAVIWDIPSGSLTDISEQLPDPSRDETVRRFSRKDITALPRFSRNNRKKLVK